MAQIHGYADTRRTAYLAGYRLEEGRGREYWDQGITELWYVAHRSDPPKI